MGGGSVYGDAVHYLKRLRDDTPEARELDALFKAHGGIISGQTPIPHHLHAEFKKRFPGAYK